jgi:fatty-acyl-CoA synthase
MTAAKIQPKLSYFTGGTTPELMHITIGQALDRTAERYPDSPGLISRHQGMRYTYAELRAAVEQVARGLMAMGIQKGDRVGIWATNCAEWVLIQFATAKIGAIMVNMNLRYRAHELKYALRQSECQSLFLIQGFHDCNYVETLFSLSPGSVDDKPGDFRAEQLPHLKNLVFIGPNAPGSMLPWETMLQMGASVSDEDLRAREASLDPMDNINIQYTSGTTGFPKGASLSHYNIVNNGYMIGSNMKMGPGESICIPVPFYHCFGMVLGNMACVTNGAAMVIPAEYFDPLATLQAIAEERCTAVHGVPTMFIAELEHPRFKEFDLSSLRTGIMAGSSCPIELMRRVVEKMHCSELTIVYGLTEASPGITQTTPEDPLELKVTTVGRPFAHTEVKIIDPQTGMIVPVGTNGELMARGYCVMNGYYNDAKATAETIEPDGWLHTGDLATVDDNGYFKITGRIKEMIIRGGENIYPREIEEFLRGMDEISDVQVFGIPDVKYGEETVAWVKLRNGCALTEDAVKQFCHGKIANFKIPRHVSFVDGFPMTVSGKIQKFKMRESAVREMGLEGIAETLKITGHQ